MNVVDKKLIEFSKLDMGWYWGEGIPTLPEIAARVRRFNEAAKERGWETDIFPGPEGDILMSFDKEELHYEVDICLDGTLSIVFEGAEEVWVDGVADEDIWEVIK